MKLPDKVLTFVRDHPLMENSVTAAPLLVRKGIKYTKLAVTLMGEAEDRRGAVLHLGTGEKKGIEIKLLRYDYFESLCLYFSTTF